MCVDNCGNYYLLRACSYFHSTQNSHLFLQMDIITLYASGMVTPLEVLVRNKPYLILYMERFRVADDFYTLVKLSDELNLGLGRNVFVILPDEFTVIHLRGNNLYKPGFILL